MLQKERSDCHADASAGIVFRAGLFLRKIVLEIVGFQRK